MDVHDPRDGNAFSGVDRDGAPLAARLFNGTSIVAVGTLGSGKSHLLRDVLRHLHANDVDPLIVHPGGVHDHDPLGVLGASSDPRARRIASGQNPEGLRPVVVVVDDAQELDEPSATALVRAVHSGHATALFALTVNRNGRSPAGEVGAAGRVMDLWLRGVAERVDLSELTADEADELVMEFGGADFDTLTRATVVGLADGSRMLLREIAAEATTALRQGRDPLQAIRETPVHGRLADVLRAHLAQLPPEHRLTLAVLGRLPRVTFADAARIVSRDVVEELVVARLVYDDGTPERRLTANPALSRAADRVESRTATVDTLRRAMRRMIAESAEWWSPALARLIADGWHRGDDWVPEFTALPEDVRVRVCEDAALLANESAEPDLAATIARRGLRVRDTLSLRVELTYAEASRGQPVDIEALAADFERETPDEATLLRWMRVRGSLPHNRTELHETAIPPVASPGPDGAIVPDFELAHAQVAAMMLEPETAVGIAEPLAARPTVSSALRVRAAITTALAYACLGRASDAQQWFTKTHRLLGERETSTALTTIDRLWAISTEIVTHDITGTDPRPAIQLLERECNAAAQEADEATIAIAGLVVAVAYASIGDADRAYSELKTALRRTRMPIFSSWAGTSSDIVARALALSDRGAEARALLDQVEPPLDNGMALLRHARLLAESCVHSALGEHEEAVAAARAASLLAEATPTLLARDLYQLIALGEENDLLLAKMSRLAEATEAPEVRILSDRAAEIVAERRADAGPSAQEAVRLGAMWAGSGQRDWARRINGGRVVDARPGSAAHGESVHALTRREREIALLVAEGLSNREIATRLYLSVRTVESHIYQARSKVGAHTRGDLGHLVAQQARSAMRGRRMGY